jgi:hypothetical protein
MSEREKMVWASGYAQSSLDPYESAVSADRVVASLRELAIDDHGVIRPEYDAARSCQGIGYEEFESWYPTALKIATQGRVVKIADHEIRDAYERYRRSACDFY